MDLAHACRAAVDGAGLGLCVVDHGHVVTLLNPAAADLLECSPEGATGRRWDELLAESGPGRELLSSLPAEASAGGSVARHVRLPRRDGTTLEVVASASVVDEMTVVVLRSIPGHAPPEPAAASDWEGLFRRGPDVAFLLATDGRILEANQAAAEAYGYSHSELLGMSVEQLRAPATAPLLLRQVAAAADTAGGSYETTHVRRDGTRLPVEVHLKAATPEPGGPLLCTVRDLTARRRNEQARTMAAVGQLAAGVAHEINNVLASMVLQAERAALKDTLEAYRQLGELVPRAVARGTEICRTLTAFSRPPDAPRRVTPIEPILEAALSIAAAELESAGVAVTRCWAATPETALVAERQIQQVFLSLFDNARDAMPAGGELRVTTSTEESPDGRTWIAIEVADSGLGIEPEHLSQVFTPFFTTKASLGEGEVTGLGLGLSVSRSIVAGHGGTIVAHSRVGVGSSFIVRLPVARPETDCPRSEGAAETGAGSPGALRLLLVEDDADLRDTLAEAMAIHGYAVTTAGDGEEGATAVSRGDFDVVVTDLMMPAGGGAAVIRAANTLPTPPAIIAITGQQEPTLERELATLGVRDVLRKPFRQIELAEAIGAATRR